MPRIAIVWDFDNTLSPDDSTTGVVEVLSGEGKGTEFWRYIHSLKGTSATSELDWEHILAMDAPIWMYALSRLAGEKKIPLNTEFFKTFVLPRIDLFEGVALFLKSLKDLQNKPSFKSLGIEIHHFIVSAGLKDLIELVFEADLITWTYGCRYVVSAAESHLDEPESIPVFCMDETMKTRALFEISKGSFRHADRRVNRRIDRKDLWVPFENIVYVGDGPTDIPAISLVRERGGLGIVVYDPSKPKEKIEGRLRDLRLDRRTDLIAAADYSLKGELYSYLETHCHHIRQRIASETFLENS